MGVVVSELPDGLLVPGHNRGPRRIECCLFGGRQVVVLKKLAYATPLKSLGFAVYSLK